MKILALDPATKCGFCYLGDAGRISGTWDLSTRRDESTGMKLLRLESKLVEFKKVGVDLVTYETPANHTYPLALISHAKFIGVIERFCTKNEINFRGFAPTEIKKWVTGKGNAKKEAMVEKVNERFGLAITDHNEADAVAILELTRSLYDVPEQEIPF